jgi:alkanesulfonate monooxygenase SsuD/methylene tetrahydromethanopterin reductase-like flavin-dependent oxidoreductase (luciferase family)
MTVHRRRVGVQLPEVEREVHWPEIRQMARLAEDAGFDSLWTGDHLLFRDDVTGTRGPWEGWSMLAALAEATETIEIGPLVAATSFHNPAMIAKKAVTIDEISGRRLHLGLGAGWNRVEYEAFGFPFDHRVARFEEAFHIIVTLLDQGVIDHEGPFYTMRHMEMLPAASRHIPLMLGSNGPRMLRIALPHVDGWNTWFTGYGNRAEGLPPLLDTVRAACSDVGRDIDELSLSAAVLVQTARGTGRIGGSTERPDVPPITGSAGEMADSINALFDAGLDHLQLVIDPIDPRSIAELAAVLPLLDR